MKKSSKITIKKLLMMVLVIAFIAGCSSNGSTSSNSSSNNESTPSTTSSSNNESNSSEQAKPFAGQTVVFAAANHPWTQALEPLIPEFEELTGAKVELESYFEDQLSQRLNVQFTSGSSTPDVFMYLATRETLRLLNNGLVEPLNDYVNRNAEYDFADISPSAIGTTSVDGSIAAIPIITEQQIMYYRKDLLEQHNIPVPTTMDELVEAAAKLHDPDNKMYGFVARGQRANAVTQASSFVFSEGGDFITDGKASINTPEALKAFGTYGGLLKDYGPPGVLNMTWPEAMGVFAQGQVAFYVDSTAIYKNALDPEKSTVADHVGFAVLPAGSAGSKPYNIASWAIAMNANSDNKDLAWAFMEWATSKEVMLKTQAAGNPGARDSVWAHEEGTKGFPAELISIIQESSKNGVGHNGPVVISVDEARDVVGGIIVKAILGEDYVAEAEAANPKLQEIIDKEK